MSADDASGLGDVFVKFGLGGEASHARRKAPETPFNMLVMASLSGGNGDGKILRLDADNYEDVFHRIAPSVTVGMDGDTIELSFRELEDFEPDRLLHAVPALASLLDIRKRLRNPQTAAAARGEALELLGLGTPVPETASPAEEPPAEQGGDSFADLLGRPAGAPPSTPAAATPRTPGAGIADGLIRGILADSATVVTPDVDNSGLLSGIESALTERLGHILHCPAFQALEATWRGIDFLMSTLETDEELRLYVMDLSLDTLRQELMSAQDLRTTRLLDTLSNHEGTPWSMLIGDYFFTPSDEDVALLGRLGIIAMSLGAPFVSAATSELAGVASLADPLETRQLLAAAESQPPAWTALRGTPVADHLALTFPRVLMRMPYGGSGDAIDTFDYDEMAAGRRHGHYLWGCGAYLCGYVYGRAFLDQGGQMNPRAYAQVSGIPAHAFTEDGERCMQPCAETWLAENHVQVLSGMGLFPMVSVRNRDTVQLASLTSIAYPAKALAGRWR